MLICTAIGLPGGTGQNDPMAGPGQTVLLIVGGLCVSLNEAGAIAEPIAAGP